MKNVAIIQARLGSSRFPGKMLHPLAGQPVIQWVVERVRQARTLDDIIIATSTSPKDQPLADHCRQAGWNCFRGSEEDVLDRFHQAAKAYQAGRIVRITGDCPMIDPALIDQALMLLEADPTIQYASNVEPMTFPEGQSVEAFPMSALQLAWENAKQPFQREHVTPYLRFDRVNIRQAIIKPEADLAHLRMTVDYPQDIELLTLLIDELKAAGRWPDYTWLDAARLMVNNDRLMSLSKLHERDHWRKDMPAEFKQ